MGLVRFETASDEIRCGYLLESSVVDLGNRTPPEVLANLSEVLTAGRPVRSRDEVTLLPPVDPKTVVQLDGCYEKDVTDDPDPHLGELASDDKPSLWVSPNSSIAADGSEVPLPAMTDDVRPGVELGLVIGEQARHITPEEASKYTAGYTICRTLRAHDPHPGLYGYRMFPGFLGVGPTIVPEIELPVALGVRHDNKTVDRSSTARLRFPLGELVSYASHVFTLEPGDLVVTGNPVRTTDSVKPDETVTAWVESIGQQTAALVSEEDSQ